ncbi:hypothetical protein F511_46743 [Dorcoceras hygrometricum]|uniref:Uncharacterized protein n=1 Tax=Dorcoceras hygrometricum TaxID=472368 RepID=A0A2Z6ZTT1_9LAMI|nr:hypothetical protein F511_46743 [Dorcoceras hygrometricum]
MLFGQSVVAGVFLSTVAFQQLRFSSSDSAVEVFKWCFQQLDSLSRSADRFFKSNQQMLLSQSADIILSLQRVFAKKCKRQRFD